MKKQNYYTAYDQDGNLIRYDNINDVPTGKQSGALSEQLYREEGLDAFAKRFNALRRKQAMQQK